MVGVMKVYNHTFWQICAPALEDRGDSTRSEMRPVRRCSDEYRNDGSGQVAADDIAIQGRGRILGGKMNLDSKAT